MCQKTKACTAAYGAATRALKAISKVRTATTTSPPSRRSVSPPRSPPGGWPLIFLLSRGHLGFLCSEELLDAHVFSLAHLFHVIVIFFPSCHLLFVPLWPSFVLPLTVFSRGALPVLEAPWRCPWAAALASFLEIHAKIREPSRAVAQQQQWQLWSWCWQCSCPTSVCFPCWLSPPRGSLSAPSPASSLPPLLG